MKIKKETGIWMWWVKPKFLRVFGCASDWSFVYERPMLISRLNLKSVQIGEKPLPPFLPFGKILNSCHVTWCNFAEVYFMHHWTSHQEPGRKAPSPQQPDSENFLDWVYPFHAISSNFGSAGRKAHPPVARQWKFFRLDLSISCNFQQLWFSWQKNPAPSGQTVNIF